VVLDNLQLVFPEKSEQERKKIARKFYTHLCDIIFETIKYLTISEKEARKRFKYMNLDLIEDLYAKNRSVLLLCGHYSSWEWSGILKNQIQYKGLGVYKRLQNKAADRLIRKIRGRFDAEIVSNRKIYGKLYRLSKENVLTLTLVLADQTPKPGAFKHRDTFMGIDVPVFTGSEEIAKKLDFASVYLKVVKVKRGFYEASFVLLAEDPTKYPDYTITRAFLDEIEKQIHSAPENYLWSHKRWKLRN
jgi:KDO2-lipid IV(A) lauroyltransferase